MTIDELKEEKQIAINAIKDAINNFHERTGTLVTDIDYDIKKAETGYGMHILSLNVDIKVIL